MELNKLSSLGFGSYRISIKSKRHEEALYKALASGVNLIDTSANYTDGDSEKLIGKVLAENKNLEAFVMTKAGYIQGQNLRELEQLNRQNLATQDLVDLRPDLKHSIHPDFLKKQLELSLARLGKDQVDGFLLHNPEYFFEQSGEVDAEEYYRRIKVAFTFLEEQVKLGKIRYYGISSNTLILSSDAHNFTNIIKLKDIANEVAHLNHFKLVQFPMNMVENGAIANLVDGKNLIEWCKIFKLKTFINRPLNAFTHEGLIRLATYEFMDEPLESKDADEALIIALGLMRKRWKEQNLEGRVEDLPLMQQFIKLWQFLPSPDAVDQVFHQHFFPLLAQIWGGNGLSAEEAKPFYLLYDIALLLSRRNMGTRAKEYQNELIKKEILHLEDKTPLANQCIRSYLQAGVDHVLVGMRDEKYVQMLSPLIQYHVN